MYKIIIEALWLILPAYVANSSATLAKGKIPIDSNKKFIDGQPLFGKGKTIEGFLLGISCGIFVGILQILARPLISGTGLINMNIYLGFLLSFGAMFGDLCGSFIKRRMKIPRGAPAPLLDQLDFVFGALLFSLILIPLNTELFLTLIIITPILHLFTNIIGYVWKIKREPW